MHRFLDLIRNSDCSRRAASPQGGCDGQVNKTPFHFLFPTASFIFANLKPRPSCELNHVSVTEDSVQYRRSSLSPPPGIPARLSCSVASTFSHCQNHFRSPFWCRFIQTIISLPTWIRLHSLSFKYHGIASPHPDIQSTAYPSPFVILDFPQDSSRKFITIWAVLHWKQHLGQRGDSVHPMS